VIGFICNFMIKAVNARYHMKDNEAERATSRAGALGKPVTA
jgi:hypothetical protein